MDNDSYDSYDSSVCSAFFSSANAEEMFDNLSENSHLTSISLFWQDEVSSISRNIHNLRLPDYQLKKIFVVMTNESAEKGELSIRMPYEIYEGKHEKFNDVLQEITDNTSNLLRYNICKSNGIYIEIIISIEKYIK